MIIPVRVPQEASVWLVGQSHQLQEGHPAYDWPCPVCDQRIGEQESVLVYVGTPPEDRQKRWATGAAVLVHKACAGSNPTVQSRDDRI